MISCLEYGKNNRIRGTHIMAICVSSFQSVSGHFPLCSWLTVFGYL